MKNNDQGYLLLSAVVLIIVFGLLASTVAYLANVEAHSVANQLDANKAFYIAEAGLERGIYGVIDEGISCNAITGGVNFTNISFGAGQFSVTGALYAPATLATLTANIDAAASVIPVSTLTDYASIGRVTIDGESIDYFSTATTSGACAGIPPCLVSAIRGAGGSTATTHAIGASIVQNECHLVASGGVPNLTSPIAKQEVSKDILIVPGYGWIVGKSDPSGETILNWSGSTWTRAGPYDSVPNSNLRSIAITSDTESWAVGDRIDGKALIIRWDGSTWTRVLPAASVPNQNLNSISCLESGACFAVGDQATLIQWTGSSWVNSLAIGVPAENINSIDCPSVGFCVAVANKNGSNALILHFLGIVWMPVPALFVPGRDLYGVTCVNSNDCWAVGQQSTFAHWNGLFWMNVLPDGSVPVSKIQGVSCPASNDCWAVGTQSGSDSMFVHWNGVTWSRATPAPSVPNKPLQGVSCAAPNDCFAVGENKTIAYWNGTQWTGITPAPSVPNVHLFDTVFRTGITPSAAFWREIN